MSDPREFNFTSQNKGTQVNIGSYWVYQFTIEDCENNIDTPRDLTNTTITGTILKADGSLLVAMSEVLDEADTGYFKTDAINGVFRMIINATTSGLLTEDDLGSYDIRFTDLNGFTKVFLKEKIEFKLTASS